jgi:adiponectin receptor
MTILGICFFIFSITERFLSKEYHKIRGILFLSFGISAGTPILHLNLFNIPGNEVALDYSLWYIGGAIYVLGGLMYTIKFPERFWPGRFCIIGNSHQIHHICVLIGFFTTYLACIDSYTYRSTYKCSLR